MASQELMDMQDRARLELTLSTREAIIREMFKDNKLPADKEDRDFLMKALDGMDRTILSRAKIKSDDTAQQTQAAQARLISELLLRATPTPGKSRTEDLKVIDATVADMADGETDIGVRTFTFAEIMSGKQT